MLFMLRALMRFDVHRWTTAAPETSTCSMQLSYIECIQATNVIRRWFRLQYSYQGCTWECCCCSGPVLLVPGSVGHRPRMHSHFLRGTHVYTLYRLFVCLSRSCIAVQSMHSIGRVDGYPESTLVPFSQSDQGTFKHNC